MKFLPLLLFIVLFSSCDGINNDRHPEDNYSIKTIDNCEYIYVSRRPWDGNFSLTHKGNCKNPIHYEQKTIIIDTVEYQIIKEIKKISK